MDRVSTETFNIGDNVLLASQGVSFTEVQQGLIARRGGQCLGLAVSLRTGIVGGYYYSPKA